MKYDIFYSDYSKIYTIDIYGESGWYVETEFFEEKQECIDWATDKYPGIEPL